MNLRNKYGMGFPCPNCKNRLEVIVNREIICEHCATKKGVVSEKPEKKKK